MAAIDEVRQMQAQGMQDEQIVSALREKGLKYKDIVDALSQSRIKVAVEQPSPEPALYENLPLSPPHSSQEQAYPYPQAQQNAQSSQSLPSPNYEEMQPSIMSQEYAQNAQGDQQYSQQQYPQQYGQEQQYPQQEYADYSAQQQYPDQYSYQYPGYVSSDIITEISEQVVAEKFSEIRKHLEKVLDLRTTFDAKISSIDERLGKMEKIIDILHSSVLRKVGDYITNIEDMKNELVQTQKTFAKLAGAKARKPRSEDKKQ